MKTSYIFGLLLGLVAVIAVMYYFVTTYNSQNNVSVPKENSERGVIEGNMYIPQNAKTTQ